MVVGPPQESKGFAGAVRFGGLTGLLLQPFPEVERGSEH